MDDLFKKGCVEFIRNLSIIRPDLCSTVGGFRILINNLMDINYNYEDICDNILNSILYVINSPNKRKYFNGFNDLYKIFSFYTKSDFCEEVSNEKSSGGNTNAKQMAEKEEEKNKLNSQLQISKKLIKKMLNTWPGFSIKEIIPNLNFDLSDIHFIYNDEKGEAKYYYGNFKSIKNINISEISPHKDNFNKISQ